MADVIFEGRSIRMRGPLPEGQMQMVRAEVREGLSQLTEIVVEFLSTTQDIDLDKVLGRPVHIEIETEGGGLRYFAGHCVEAVYEGVFHGQGHFTARLRSWPWFLTRTTDCRIFQDLSAMEIIQRIFNDHGFTDYQDKTAGNSPKRVYCVQYRESDWDFIYRLMVEEGIYFFFDYASLKDTLVMVDEPTGHQPITERTEINFMFREDAAAVREDFVFDWRERGNVATGRVSLQDYDFEKPSSDLKVSRSLDKASHRQGGYEVYDYPGRYTETGRGETLARVRAEAHSANVLCARGRGNLRTLAVGRRFTLANHPRRSANQEYLVTEAVHQLEVETDQDRGELPQTELGVRIVRPRSGSFDPYQCSFSVQPARAPWRPPYPCPRPSIPGLQTAVVVGPKGEEIHTDQYGRVKVQFHWDREGKRDDKSSCWIRKAEPWSGKDWGMVWVPRIGQEVVVQFEEGDPDRPMIVGMLFNAETKHPYSLPANMTQMGWTTRSTEKGSASTFHELMFEDKKDAELVRFQSERDYKQIVKNNAEITIGLEHKDKGDLTQTIQNDRTETVKKGDHTFKVETGNEKYHIESNRTVTVGGNHDETVDGNQDVAVKKNQSTTVTKDQSYKVNGAQKTKVMKTIKTEAMQTITLKANQKITLQCGQSKIEMTPQGIKMSCMQFTLDAKMKAKMKAGMQMDIEGGMQLKAKGGMKTQIEGGMQLQQKGGLMTKIEGGLQLQQKGGLMTKVEGGLMYQAKGGLMAKTEGGLMGQFKGGLMGQFQGGAMAQLKGGVLMIN